MEGEALWCRVGVCMQLSPGALTGRALHPQLLWPHPAPLSFPALCKAAAWGQEGQRAVWGSQGRDMAWPRLSSVPVASDGEWERLRWGNCRGCRQDSAGVSGIGGKASAPEPVAGSLSVLPPQAKKDFQTTPTPPNHEVPCQPCPKLLETGPMACPEPLDLQACLASHVPRVYHQSTPILMWEGAACAASWHGAIHSPPPPAPAVLCHRVRCHCALLRPSAMCRMWSRAVCCVGL